MAFSMFLRRPGTLSRVFSQQIARLATQPAMMQKTLVNTCMPASTFTFNERKLVPIHNYVRPVQTSAVRYSAEVPHDHAKLWVIEKATSAILVPLIPAALIMPNKILDCALAIIVTAHSFWGLEAIAVDYVRASIFGPIIPKIAVGLVYAISIATLGGLFYIIAHDVGIANTIRNFWAIKAEKA